ncbi:MAG: LPXTG cell wall anchor domain-containing protein [Clostridia bacterium]|nr:LPXTG cell wall anchor domain-containing protein [Clostridia bacterium]
MKKTLTIILALMLAFSCMSMNAFAAESDTVNVFVTIADKDGKLALAAEEITVSDIDSDGKLTVNDALYTAHEQKYEGGAAAGYSSELDLQYGLSLKKLWGIDNGGSYGYYVNNNAAWNLAEEIHTGDSVNAFIYTDLSAWSDTYCWFNIHEQKGKEGDKVDLILTASQFDYATGNPVELPVKEARITLNGTKTAFKTNDEGKVTVNFDQAGEFVVSAVSETQILVPPVCKVSIAATEKVNTQENNTKSTSNTENATSPKTGDHGSMALLILLVSMALGATVFFAVKRIHEN